MSEEKKPYAREPIEESDQDLESKFRSVNPEKGVSGEKSQTQEQSSEETPELGAERENLAEISSAEKDSTYNKILSKTKNDNQSDDGNSEEINTDAQKSQAMDAESQIQNLVDLAMNKGVVHAVKVAKHIEDNYVLDMFHDKLMAEELHDALVKKGLIQDA